MTKRIQKAETR